uniref:Uncharacterized protein n=1 Tax=Noctiluca scintillans TaxID=2966 RepID=A0A7S0ZX77_NOCSC|mmetsp:Transcript_2233/g.6371  ORF Transcript_2233/g.6371 Transcript_2233/m.6371 type:complete len:357 (+) Transcript_2233:103-1173(+)
MPHDTKNLNDANPMNKRLPAEVISRRRRIEPPTEKDGLMTVDRKAIFVMKPEHRAKWLLKALKQAAEGRLRTSDLYDVIVSTRFIDDVPLRAGRRMERAVRDQLSLFSGKQQRFLSSEAALTVKFGKASEGDGAEEQGSEEPLAVTEKAESRAEDMMARCRDFVREKMGQRGDGGSAGSTGEAAGSLSTPGALEEDAPLGPDGKAVVMAALEVQRNVEVRIPTASPPVVVSVAPKALPRKPEELGFDAAETPGLARSVSPPQRPAPKPRKLCSCSRSPPKTSNSTEQPPVRKEPAPTRRHEDRAPPERPPARRRRRGSSVSSSRSVGKRRRPRSRSSSRSEPTTRRRRGRPRRSSH